MGIRRSDEDMGSPTMDEYQKLIMQMHDTPRVVIDNAADPSTTVIKVESARNRILLESVQALADLDLNINKAYFSSDGRWFMDVFHVTDLHGHKLTDDSVVSFIQQSLSKRGNGITTLHGLTTLELTGADRPGLLSEVFALLADLRCSVQEARVWTHNGRVASIVSVVDPDHDHCHIKQLESSLYQVLKGGSLNPRAGARVSITSVLSHDHADRRLHQLMAGDRDYHTPMSSPPSVSVHNWIERGYSIVGVQCTDRSKLLFDTVCALTDMDYTVFHGSISTDGVQAYQEFYIRHTDGSPISSDAERERVIQRLQAAIQRRSSEGLRMELRSEDRPGLRAEVTRAFRENGLWVRKAEMFTDGKMASDVFYVTDMAGRMADQEAINAVRRKIGMEQLQVKVDDQQHSCQDDEGHGRVGLLDVGNLVMRNLWIPGLIRSCSFGLLSVKEWDG